MEEGRIERRGQKARQREGDNEMKEKEKKKIQKKVSQ